MDVEAKTIDDRILEEQQKIKKAFTAREEKELVRKSAMVANVTDAVREAITVMPPPKFGKLPTFKKSNDEETAVLVLSDTHVGKKTQSYNSQVFANRLESVSQGVARITELQRSDHPVRKLVVIMDGDMVDGEGIYPTQAYHVDQAVLNQVFKIAVPAFSEFLTNMSHMFEQVDVHCVRGNHGRTGRFAEETSNWDLVLYNTLEIATAHNPRINWHITSDWYQTFDIMGMTLMVTHGHQIKSVLNLPFYGMTTKGMRWQGSVTHFDLLIIGHYHSKIYFRWNDFELMMNGTMVSHDEFAREVVGMESSCEQTLFFVHPRKKVTAYYSLQLAGVK